MESYGYALSPQAESQYLALEFMRQKSLTDDTPADIAREYRAMQQQLCACLSSGAVQAQ